MQSQTPLLPMFRATASARTQSSRAGCRRPARCQVRGRCPATAGRLVDTPATTAAATLTIIQRAPGQMSQQPQDRGPAFHRMHVRRARRLVSDPGHRDLPEHARQRPRVSRPGPGPGDPVRTRHLLPPPFPSRPQVLVILQQQPQHFPAPGLQLLLQHRVLQPPASGPSSHPSICANASRERANAASSAYSGTGLLLSRQSVMARIECVAAEAGGDRFWAGAGPRGKVPGRGYMPGTSLGTAAGQVVLRAVASSRVRPSRRARAIGSM